MKKLSNTETALENSVTYKKKHVKLEESDESSLSHSFLAVFPLQ